MKGMRRSIAKSQIPRSDCYSRTLLTLRMDLGMILTQSYQESAQCASRFAKARLSRQTLGCSDFRQREQPHVSNLVRIARHEAPRVPSDTDNDLSMSEGKFKRYRRTRQTDNAAGG